ncbi:pyridoxal 4-dehydrogenase [Burkholderia ambifaria AMMD]|nr:aldo/keto reductase [Burkholderia ambifaria]AJY22123.1 pyridoxal 4-dehydrogenase [Burkholderia ambifaria AMMD]MBR7929595.1 aldo/keto reductase [Burkholderia ambifaria]QQC02900.1 aldo/keto reductase [Burkholderia ambifaria]UZU06347.1 aldo/keto reductase [Burkholderia ambifaria]UZU12903.1 aldo/keto reductase [Burkholderia ambifaria]
MSTLGFGCSQLGGLYKAMSTADAHALVDWAWDAGIRYFDTAPFYGYTLSERRVGQSLQARARKRYVLSTKVGRLMRPDDTVQPGDDGWAHPLPFRPHFDYTFDGIMRSYEDSQQRLGMRTIDILYVHDIGAATHGDRHAHYWEQLTRGGGFRALAELRDARAISAIGLGVNEWEVAVDAMQEADLDVVLLAGRYTLLEQEALSPLLDRCVRNDVRIVAGGVFNSGVLVGNGKFNYADAPAEVIRKVARLADVCAGFGVPLAAAALQFPLAHPAVVSCVVGARSIEQLQKNIAWLETPLPPELWTALQHDGLITAAAPVPEVCA